jgi:hypothetical protein
MKGAVMVAVDRLGKYLCHHGRKIGDSFALSASGHTRFCCSDVGVVNVFKITVEEEQ